MYGKPIGQVHDFPWMLFTLPSPLVSVAGARLGRRTAILHDCIGGGFNRRKDYTICYVTLRIWGTHNAGYCAERIGRVVRGGDEPKKKDEHGRQGQMWKRVRG